MKPLCLYLEVSHHLIQEELIVGMIVGLIIRVSPGMMIQGMVSFKYSIFFNFLLPPIILNSGYELHQVIFHLTPLLIPGKFFPEYMEHLGLCFCRYFCLRRCSWVND